MKKLITFIVMAVVATSLLAQSSVVVPPVKMNARATSVYRQKRQVAVRKSPSSSTPSTTNVQKQQGICMTQIVDLGLSVNWAGWNLGASSPEQYGGLYGWGDAKGIIKSTDPAYYPTPNPPLTISGGQYDTARYLWGRNWRMPSAYEMLELYNECTWQWMYFKGVAGVKITGPNGNAIFIPAAGAREGFEQDAIGEEVCLWSGASDQTDSNNGIGAFSIAVGMPEFGQGIDREFYAEDRHLGMSIRPVYDSGMPLYELSKTELEPFSTWGDGADFGDKTTVTRADMRRALSIPILSMSTFENGRWGQRKPFNGMFFIIWEKQLWVQSESGILTYYINSCATGKDNQGYDTVRFECVDNGGNRACFDFSSAADRLTVSFPGESEMIRFETAK